MKPKTTKEEIDQARENKDLLWARFRVLSAGIGESLKYSCSDDDIPYLVRIANQELLPAFKAYQAARDHYRSIQPRLRRLRR